MKKTLLILAFSFITSIIGGICYAISLINKQLKSDDYE